MSRKLQETISDEKGQALIWALIALTLGTLLVTAFILLLNTNVQISGKRHTKVWEIYSTDSGIEYGIFALQNHIVEVGIRDTEVVTLEVGSTPTPVPVNEVIITATIENSTPVAPDYVIFANSTTCPNTIYWGSSGTTIGGDTHSNNDIYISGSPNKVMTGTLEYVVTVTGTEKVDFKTSPNPVASTVMTWPVSYDINDYAPGGSIANQAQAEGKYHYIEGDLAVSGQTSLDGLYYVTGNVRINSSSSPLTMTIVTEGTINPVNATNAEYTAYTDDGLLFFSNANTPTPDCEEEVIRVTGGNKVLHGDFYAPYGQIYLSGAGNEDVKLLGHTIEFQGSGLGSTAMSSLEDRSLLPPGCFYYDITSTRGDTETRARVLMCNDQPTILSWLVD